ncbi:MAG: ester cyclase [Candidatus Methanomethylicaceae archaeon]|jgi:predicted ester cyclase
MLAEKIKALERRWYAEANKGKAATMTVIDEDCTTNIVFHSSTGMDIRGLKDFKQFMSEFYDAFPDIHWTLDDLIVEGDKAVVRYTVTGTHRGAFMGIPPTNKKVTIWGIEIDREAGGKWVEAWGRMDTLGFMQQLGAVPTPGKPK